MDEAVVCRAVYRGEVVKTVHVYYPDAGLFGCWKTAVEIELSKLSEHERRTAVVICHPENRRSEVEFKRQNKIAGV